MEFTGGTVFFGADKAVTDVTAAVGARLDLMLMRLQCSPGYFTQDHAIPMVLPLREGSSDETSILAEMTNLGVGAGAASGASFLTVADTFSADPYLHHLIQHHQINLGTASAVPFF